MNSSANIQNAFKVVHQTYENIQKLFEYCKQIATEHKYVVSTDKFLRYKSDNHTNGWYIQDFILLFQKEQDIELENEWRNGSIFALEIELFNNENSLEPTVYLSKFDFKDITSWSSGCSPANHWRFYNPTRNKQYMSIESSGGISIATPLSSEIGERYYWGLEKVTTVQCPLININAQTVGDIIFNGFDNL